MCVRACGRVFALARRLVVAFDSSTIAAFCCVALSIWFTALLPSGRPVDCSYKNFI